MIDTQARIITQLRTDLKEADQRRASAEARYEQIRPGAEFYSLLQDQILANPLLQSEWVRFCSFLKLSSEDDVEKQSKKLSAEIKRRKRQAKEDDSFSIPFMF